MGLSDTQRRAYHELGRKVSEETLRSTPRMVGKFRAEAPHVEARIMLPEPVEVAMHGLGPRKVKAISVTWRATVVLDSVVTVATARGLHGNSVFEWTAWDSEVDGLPEWVPPMPAWLDSAAHEMVADQ